MGGSKAASRRRKPVGCPAFRTIGRHGAHAPARYRRYLGIRLQHDIPRCQRQSWRRGLAITCSGLAIALKITWIPPALRSAALFSDADDQDFWTRIYVVNVGDSCTLLSQSVGARRCSRHGYHSCGDAASLTRITRDHSQRQEAIDSGQMLPEEAEATISHATSSPNVWGSGWHHARRICRRSDWLLPSSVRMDCMARVPDEQITAIAAARFQSAGRPGPLVASCSDGGHRQYH